MKEWKEDAFDYLCTETGESFQRIADFIDCYWQNQLSNEENRALFYDMVKSCEI